MPEGLLTASGVTGAVHDDADHKPEPSAEAPRDWTWNRRERKWQPRQRGPVVFRTDASGTADRVPDGSADLPGGSDSGAQRDPDPSWIRDGKQHQDKPGGKSKLKFSEVPRQVKDEAASMIGLVATPILALLQTADPYCGSILAENFEPIVDATLPLILRSERVVKYFTEDDHASDWVLWFRLAAALAPAGRAFVQHHVLRSVEVVRDEHGRPFVQPRTQEGHGDGLTPQPQPEPYPYAA